MFDRYGLRLYIAMVWLAAFCLLWGVLQYALPGEELLDKIDLLEEAVDNDNWPSARKIISDIDSEWKKKQFIVQLAKGSEQVGDFTEHLEEAKLLIHQEKDDVFSSIAAMKHSFEALSKAFPGP